MHVHEDGFVDKVVHTSGEYLTQTSIITTGKPRYSDSLMGTILKHIITVEANKNFQ